MLDISKLLDVQSADHWKPGDHNHDGVIDGRDIPYEPGTLDCMKCWAKIDAMSHCPEMVAKAKLIHPHAVGMYHGKVLVPGEAGANQADFEFLRDQLVFAKGYSPEVATKIAAKIKWQLYNK